jgi:hypothetical protein
MRLARTVGLAAGLAMVGSMALATGASARPIEHMAIHEENTEIIENFCAPEVSGLTVQADQVLDGRELVNSHGPDGLVYFSATLKITNVFTNVDNGNSVTELVNILDKDLRVTDNGDGTLTILFFSTGSRAVHGSDGKVLARDAGQIRVEILVDHGGTPSDPSDDEFLEFLGVVMETGRTDDFCAAVVPALTG